jgi:sarcosine oxidase subunit delta
MLLIPCPHCGPRAEIEFRHAGEAHLVRRTDGVDDAEWGAYLYARANPRGEHRERWRHIHGCGRFFNVVRNTLSDRITASYATGTRPEDRP